MKPIVRTQSDKPSFRSSQVQLSALGASAAPKPTLPKSAAKIGHGKTTLGTECNI